MNRVFESFLSFVFPPICIHCQEITKKPSKFLCDTCLSHLIPLHPNSRCQKCFSLLEEKDRCEFCFKKSLSSKYMAAVFDYMGPAASLICEFKYRGYLGLSLNLASFMVVQFAELDWPLPDFIVPVPQAISRYIFRGYNQSFLIAKEMGKLLGTPVNNLLKRRSGELPQATLSQDERKKLSSASFYLKKNPYLKLCKQEKKMNILLVDDVMTTRTTLLSCAKILKENLSADIYAMSFCSA